MSSPKILHLRVNKRGKTNMLIKDSKSFLLIVSVMAMLSIISFAGGVIPILAQQSYSVSFKLNVTNDSAQPHTVTLRFASPNNNQIYSTGVEAHGTASSTVNISSTSTNGQPTIVNLCTEKCQQLDLNRLGSASELNVKINPDGSFSVQYQ